MKNWSLLFICFTLLVFAGCSGVSEDKHEPKNDFYEDARPYTRWWWFAAEYEKEDIIRELDWVKARGVGGVEISFIYPVDRDPEAKRFEWLSPEWREAVTFAKIYADSIGLGCDFTFGTLWPFGGTFVSDADRTRVFGDPDFKQPLRLSWTHPDTGNVLDHLNRNAFERYAAVMGNALEPALENGKPSALFCDSWEVETRKIWTQGFDSIFEAEYGYDILPFMDDIYEPGFEGQRYDYMKLVSELVIDNFYIPFAEKSRELDAFSRVQCAGSPTDLIKAYSVVDVPETEVMLYNPSYSRIVASATALSGKPVVSSETFTCLYGWPREHMMEEKIGDLKMVADACFANGVNQIFWHGKPFSFTKNDETRFYATVHVGKKGSLSPHLKSFNQYLTEVSKLMRQGRPYTDVAVYLPLEDAWIAGEYPEELQLPWAWGAYELRYMEFPEELKAYHPMWINHAFLEKARINDKQLVVGESVFHSLYVDAKYLDADLLKTLLYLAKQGLPIVMKQDALQAGHVKDNAFEQRQNELFRLDNVSRDFDLLELPPPLLDGEPQSEYWCRKTNEALLIFISHPAAWNLKYPLEHGFSNRQPEETMIMLRINHEETSREIPLVFKPYQSVILEVKNTGEIRALDIHYPVN
ncbi:MAG: hypothetical protein K9G58_12970 [Bacteroidales bacterium]|nr:hypothetical protein [Bacteroidales bacterium]MCF8399080.1 hypothetical protein [Bacteroidales bacterium]